MKLAIVGGGGVRVPLLVHGLSSRGLPIRQVALFDIDPSRLQAIAALTRTRTPQISISTHDGLVDCIRGADFIVLSVRVGGVESRHHDESVAIAHGIVGQETIGPAGFAMAVRTIPIVTAYAAEIARHAPDAWIINFTNPVGIITQALRRASTHRVIGICDTPTELFAEIAHALEVSLNECAFDYIGLNHLGWVREVYRGGKPLLHAMWDDPALLAKVYSRPIFPPEYLARLRLLPTEYVYYYDFPNRALANIRASGTNRGAVVAQLTNRLFRDLAAPSRDAIDVYETYLAERSASYMQLESGQPGPNPTSPWAELTGYDRIAFDVMHSIVHDSHAVIPLDVPNAGNIPELDADDVVEVPCLVGSNGPRALHVGTLPAQIRDRVVQVKAYERRTIDAATTMTTPALLDALAHNPLVSSRDVAASLLSELRL
jgi:6-phospho-beta-glucosidase